MEEDTPRIEAFKKAVQAILDIIETKIPTSIFYGYYGDYGIQIQPVLEEMGKELLSDLRRNAEAEIDVLVKEKNVYSILRDVDTKVEENREILDIYNQFGRVDTIDETLTKLRITYKKRLVEQLHQKIEMINEKIKNLKEENEKKRQEIQQSYQVINSIHQKAKDSKLISFEDSLRSTLDDVL